MTERSGAPPINRKQFVASSLALFMSGCAAFHKQGTQMSPQLQSAIDDARKRSVRLELRHVGANVATAMAILPDKLGLMRPIATVDDARAIGATLDAIVAAGPQLAKQTNEQRWHLRFIDGEEHTVLVVMTSIFTPYDGFIGGESVRFADGSLVRFLSERYAPLDVPSLRD